MLCLLNHELLPDPGSPIARTTTPLVEPCGRAMAGAGFGDTAVAAGVTRAPGCWPGRLRPRPPRRRRRGRRFGSPASALAVDSLASPAGLAADSELPLSDSS